MNAYSSGQRREKSEGCVPKPNGVNVFKVCVYVCVSVGGGGALATSQLTDYTGEESSDMSS